MSSPDQPDTVLAATDATVSDDLAAVGELVMEIFPEALGVWVYGSVADGTARAARDIDIVILSHKPLAFDWDDMGRSGQLDGRLPRRVDFVDLRRVPLLLRFEIFNAGWRVACTDESVCDRYETTVISQYQRLNVERRDIFQAIAARGSVYRLTR